MIRKLAFLCVLLFAVGVSGQQTPKLKTFSQKDFNAYKIHQDTYDLWHRNMYNRENDTISYFVNSAEYNGVINYGVAFSAYDKKIVNYIEDYFIYFQQILIDKCAFNPNDSIADISGRITGGWNIVETKGMQKQMQVIVGEKKDTTYNVYFKPNLNSLDVYKIEYKNQVRKTPFVLDTLPAFRMTNTTLWKKIGDSETFSVHCKVNPESVLVFGEISTFTEIFDIGELFFAAHKKPGKTLRERTKDDPRLLKIIEKNEQVKYRKPPKPDANYYVLTGKAEDYIMTRQYANAKETYGKLASEYPNIFARDIHNAIRVSILSRDLNAAQVWGEKMAMKGVDSKYFNAKIFNGMKNSQVWKSFSARFDSISKDSQSKRNDNLRQQLDALTDEDQAFYGLENRKEAPVLHEITQVVTEKLVALLQKEGFPSEEKIGVFTRNDTVISQSPRFSVLIRHAVQQKPKTLGSLLALLDKSFENLEYDKKRSSDHRSFEGACMHIYKGNLYNDKSCGNNDMMVRRMLFKFNNPNGFIMDYGDFIVSEYDKDSPEELDKYYATQFNFVVKLTDDWEFYER